MRTLKRFLLSLAVATAVLAVSAHADQLRTQKKVPVGTSVTDTLRWHSSGAIPGTSPLKVDTFVAGTLNDTTMPFDIFGAKRVSVTVLSRGRNDDSDFTVYAQVSPQSDTLAVWHTLNVSYSVDNTAGTELGGVEDTARDTTFWILQNETIPDSMYSAQTGMTSATHGDQAYVRASNYIRFWVDPDASAGDSTDVTIIITAVY